ncbi:MAG: asparagine synthase (glutamine-hydrolyzing) [Magnetovibrio sp.]|nr:asparagine synthase (glutamine-hydrolyzing) [Magnetovibrio sp.]
MCGIFGQFLKTTNSFDPQRVESLCRATNYLTHRGPDSGRWWSEGQYYFGHRRLSIIDLDHGQQPMVSEDGQYVIAFNGEIYNYIELRQELIGLGHVFKTDSDTEVILEGYKHWGEGLCEHLTGMFAFAIADRINGGLFLARDRFGEKPLFIKDDAEAVTFSSELGAFNQLDNHKGEVDQAALGGYLCLNYVPGEDTLAKGIKRLPVATWRKYDANGQVRQYCYWHPSRSKIENTSFTDAMAHTQTLLDEGVKLSLRSDVPVTLFLSGGIDSTLIADSVKRQSDVEHAYCLDFTEPTYSEYDAAKYAADTLGLDLRRVPLTADALEEFLPIAERLDDPLADSSALAVWTLARETAKDYKVVLSGDGGDELFGGYLTYKATALHNKVSAMMPHPVRKLLAAVAPHIPVSATKVSTSYKARRFLRALDLDPAEAHFTWNGTWLPNEATRFFADPEYGELAKGVLKAITQRDAIPAHPSLDELQRTDIVEYLPNDILTKTDRTTMAFGLESRASFLYPKLAEYGINLPDDYKMPAKGKPKHILRQLAAQKYGTRISQAKKQGFSIPVHTWLRHQARHIMEELLSPQRLKDMPFLDANHVIKIKNLHSDNKAQYGFELWGLMCLSAWHNARILGRGTDNPIAQLDRIEFPSLSGAA